MAGTVERLALDLALNRLGQLERALSDLRARTGTLVAASSVAVSLLGAQALEQAGPTALNAVGLAAFCITIGASAYVLLPKDSVILAFSGNSLVEIARREQLDLPGVERRVARWLDFFADESQRAIRRLGVGYRCATAALVVEVVLWSVEAIAT